MAELNNTSLVNDANLVSYWRLEGNSNDSKGANNGTDTSVSYSAANGKYGQGGGFDGATSKIVIADAASLKPGGNFSIGGWINLTSGSPAIFQSYNQTGGKIAGYQFYITGGVIHLLSGANSGLTQGVDYQDIGGASTISTGNWNHVFGTYDGSNLKVYLNGQLDGSVAWSTIAVYQATNFVRLGCGNNTGSDTGFFSGNVDDFALFSKALSLSEIQTLFNDGRFLSLNKGYW